MSREPTYLERLEGYMEALKKNKIKIEKTETDGDRMFLVIVE